MSDLARPEDVTLDRDEMVAAMFLVGFPANTRRGYEASLKTWFRWCSAFGIAPLTAQRAHIELWMRELSEHGNRFAKHGPRPLMPATVGGNVNAVAGYYKFAHREGYITDDITQYLKRPKVPTESSRQGLTRFELRACLDVAKESRQSVDYALWCVLVFNGLRISEACAIDVEDLGMSDGYRTMFVHRAKGNRSGRLPLAPVTSHAVDRYLGTRTTGPLFLKPRIEERLDQKSANRIVKRVTREAGVTKIITPHSLRHTHATLALNEGVGARELADSMGWSDVRPVTRYDRDRGSYAKSATWSVAGALEGF